ncbi:MAG: putative membrane protein, partial [Candidatus Azotimanducaceae bacterium]
GFFASTTLILLAATFTAVSASEQIAELTGELPFSLEQTTTQIQTKFILIAVMLIYAFFQITWSLRQYGFIAVLMGAAPMPGDDFSDEERAKFVQQLARLMDVAGHDNNAGLRTYYFCLAMVFWILNPYFYIAATTLIVAVLARREFKSKTVKTLEAAL